MRLITFKSVLLTDAPRKDTNELRRHLEVITDKVENAGMAQIVDEITQQLINSDYIWRQFIERGG